METVTSDPPAAEPVVTPEPTPDPVATPDAGDWKASLPEDLRNDKTLANIKSVEDLARMNVDAQKLVGADKTVIPGENATDEDWSAFFSAAGRPNTAEDYKLKPKAGEGENPVVDETLLKNYSEAAHKAGLTTRQANAMMGFYEGVTEKAVVDADELILKAKNETVATLKKEYGNTYDAKIELARGAMRHIGGQDLVDAAESEGYGNNAGFVRMMVEVGGMIGEDRVIGQSKPSVGKTPDEASSEIARLQADSGFMKQYFTSADPMHKQAVQTMRKLQLEATGADNQVIGTQGTVSSS